MRTMKLQLITHQGGNFDEYYAACGLPNFSASLLDAIEKIRKLFAHLEQNIEAPPQWVTISHLVIFYLSDTDDWRPKKARVFVNPALNHEGYEIKYRSARELHFWDSFTKLEARDEIEAGTLIVEALERAERDLPGRGD